MKIAIIGRSEVLYDTAVMLNGVGHEIVCILTAKEAPEYKRGVEDFKNLAKTFDATFARGAQIDKHYELFQNLDADIAVSINYSGIIPQSIIDLFPLGILNVHAGDLPKYRGNACQAWAILNGEDKIGLCVHKMIGGELDSGEIIRREYFPIDHTVKITRVMEWIRERTPELMLDSVEILRKEPHYYLEKQPTDSSAVLRCYPRKPEDGKIDWSKSAIEILRLINATNQPYSGAFCNFEGNKLIIWDAMIVGDTESFCAVAGQVMNISEQGAEIACGSGKILVTEIEYMGAVIKPKKVFRSIRQRLA